MRLKPLCNIGTHLLHIARDHRPTLPVLRIVTGRTVQDCAAKQNQKHSSTGSEKTRK